MIKYFTLAFFLVFSQFSTAATKPKQYIPDSQILNINCSTTGACSSQFTIKDTIWTGGVYGFPVPIYANSADTIIAITYAGTFANFAANRPDVTVGGLENCEYHGETAKYCDVRGSFPIWDWINQRYDSWEGVISTIAAGRVYAPPTIGNGCPGNEPYVAGLGCTTPSYTDPVTQEHYETTREPSGVPSDCDDCSTNMKTGNDDVALYEQVKQKQQQVLNGVNITSKSAVQTATDLSYPFPFVRNYSSNRTKPVVESPLSRTTSSSTTLPNFGNGWNNNFSNKLTIIQSSLNGNAFAATLIFKQANDEEIIFTRSTPEEDFELSYKDQRNFKLALLNGDYILTVPNGNIQTYNYIGNFIKLKETTGSSYNLAYNIYSQLTSITNNYEQSISIIYVNNDSPLIYSLNSTGGDTIYYTYDENDNLTGVSLNHINNVEYSYNENNQLESISDELNQNIMNFSYDSNGYVSQSNKKVGTNDINQYNYSYPNANTVVVTQPNANTITYGIQTFDYIPVINTYTEGNNTYSITYSSTNNGQISSYTDSSGNNNSFTYDANGRIISITRPSSYTTEIEWNSEGLISKITQPSPVSGHTLVTNYLYDYKRNIVSKEMIGGSNNYTWSYVYNIDGNLVSATNPDGSSISNTYYASDDPNPSYRGLLHTTSNGLAQTITINAYDGRGNPTSVTGIDNTTKQYTYNSRGQVLSELFGGALTNYTYDLAGNLTKVVMANGYEMNMTYDQAQRLTGISDNHGGYETYTLDNDFNKVTNQNTYQGSTLVSTLNNTLDGLGRVTQNWTNNSSIKSTFSYNGGNTVTSATNANGVNSNMGTNYAQQITSYSSGSDYFNYSYDKLNNLTSASLNYQNTTMTYDEFNRIVTMVSPDTGSHTYSYNVAGRTKTHTDNAGTVHTISYNLAGQPISYIHVNGSTTLTETLAYNSYGQLTTLTDSSGTTTYTYDVNGRLATKVQTIGSQSFTINYTYDLAGQLLTETYPSGLIVNYTYSNGILTGKNTTGTITKTVLSDISYQTLSENPISWKLFGDTVTATYGTDNLIKDFSDNVMTQAITTDNIGNVTNMVDLLNSNTISATYNYVDQLLTSNVDGNTSTYYYTSNGNLYNQTFNGNTIYSEFISGTNKQSALIIPSGSSFLTYTYTYDSNGNMTTDAINNYTYDLKNNLNSSTDSSSVTTNYVFNSLGQRVKKSNSTTDTYYVYNGNQLIGEYDSAGNVIQEHLYFGLRPVAVSDGTELYAVHTDYLSTPRIIKDDVGTTVWEWRNEDVYGKNLPSISLITYNLRFSGQYFDNENNLHYNYYRTYNPLIGRYMQSDPIGLAAGSNTYNYVNRNSLSNIDSFGLIKLNSFYIEELELINKVKNPNNIHEYDNGQKYSDGYLLTDKNNRIAVGLKQGSNDRYSTNCHGTTFAQGKFWINPSDVPTILKDEWSEINYSSIKPGDIGIRWEPLKNGKYDAVHSFTVNKTNIGYLGAYEKFGTFPNASFILEMPIVFKNDVKFYRRN